jgi:E3 ubiquitin-protein ligase RGLG
MIFSALVLLFCFTWSFRLKAVAAAGHGSAGADQNYGTLDQVSDMFTFTASLHFFLPSV